MVEIIDNAVQLGVTVFCTVWSAIIAVKKRNQLFFLICCFYGTFALGLAYWLLYLIMMSYTPVIFYVSDLTWIGSWLFLLVLGITMKTPGRQYHGHPFTVVLPILSVVNTIYLLPLGDIIVTSIWGGLAGAVSYFFSREFLVARSSSGSERKRQYFYLSVLVFFLLENLLWFQSANWVSDTLTNPYFWIDFGVTASMLAMLIVMRRVVKT